MNGKRSRKADLILLVSLAAAGAVLAICLLLFSHSGGEVRVSVDGEITAVYDLNTDREVDIAGYEGGSNHLVIRGGTACITEATCPDGLCIGMGTIRRSGQSIVCLPNRVVVEIVSESGSSDSGYDLVAGRG